MRPADDPVFRRIGGRMRPLRLGRGSAPVELTLPWRQSVPVLAVGGHMKGALALSWDDRVVVSPHIGEMDSPRSLAVFEQVAADLQALYGVAAAGIVCDAHSGYTTHQWARRQALPVETVWTVTLPELPTEQDDPQPSKSARITIEVGSGVQTVLW